MRIDTRQIIQQVPGVKPKGLPGTQEAGPADSVDLSTRAADIQRAIDALKARLKPPPPAPPKASAQAAAP